MNTPTTTPSPTPEPPAASFTGPVLISLTLAAVSAIVSWWVWRQLAPGARVPTHWNFAGQVDGYSGRNSLFILPGMMVGLTLLFRAVPLIEPRRANLLRSSRAYRAVWLATVVFCGGLNVFVVQAATGVPVAIERWMGLAVGGLFLVIGNFLGKVRSNFMFGVRTPWTLSSERSWNRTNRLAGWMFVGLGFVFGGCGFVPALARHFLFVVLGGVAAMLLTVVPFSYFVWRSDPNKTGDAKDDSEDASAGG